MMKRKPFLSLPFTGIILSSLLIPLHAQQSLTGSYTMSADQTSLTLTLNQAGSQLTGNLGSTTGASYQLQGEVMEGVGAGVCAGEGTSIYFEVYLQGNELTLGLIEPDEFNMPDYNKSQYLLFKRQPGQANYNQQTGSVSQQLFGNQSQQGNPSQPGNQGWQQQSQSPQTNNQPQQSWSEQARPAASGGSSKIGANEVGDPSWGFKFVPPGGWVNQRTADGVILGHNTIAGMILVLPHNAQNMQQMQQELAEGLQEEGSYLSLNGSLSQAGQNILEGNYSGIADGTQVSAKGFGVLSPYGGGAYLIALSTPDKLGSELTGAAGSIARNMQFFKQETSDLMRHFAGNWSTFTTNTSTWMSLAPNGVYSDQYESAYSGNTSDGYGNVTGNWGTAGQNSGQGRWTVRGTKEAGQLVVTMNNGREVVYNYKVHQENGRYFYSEYWFNGSLYSKK